MWRGGGGCSGRSARWASNVQFQGEPKAKIHHNAARQPRRSHFVCSSQGFGPLYAGLVVGMRVSCEWLDSDTTTTGPSCTDHRKQTGAMSEPRQWCAAFCRVPCHAPSTVRPLARDPRVLIGWPLPLGFGLDGRLLLARRGGVGGFMFNSSSSSSLCGRLRQSSLPHCLASSPRLEGHRPGDGRPSTTHNTGEKQPLV